MQLRWTAEAADDLEHITDYLLTHAPDRALELARTVYDAPSVCLAVFRVGRDSETSTVWSVGMRS